MPVYILQEGQSHIFKIGRTTGNVEDVIRTLHRGNSHPLSLFDVVVTDQESACEAFFHRRLRSKRVARGGGREFFELEPFEMRRTVANFRQMFEDLEAARRTVSELSKQQSTDRLLDPTPEDEQLLVDDVSQCLQDFFSNWGVLSRQIQHGDSRGTHYSYF